MTHLIDVGADPEVWLTKNGLIVPSVGLIKGTKEKPFVVEGSKVGLTLQEDNVSVELGWKPVKVDKFTNTATSAFSEAETWVRNNIGEEYGLLANKPDHIFLPEDLVSEQAQVFGCLPDQDAYLEGTFRTPIDPKDGSLGIGNHRFAGGHIHLGYDKANAQVPPFALVRMLDWYYLYLLYDGYDNQGSRRKLYGQPGIYRDKPYGVEYRTPGNFWLYNPSRMQSMASFAQMCLNKPRATQKAFKSIMWDRVQESIKTEYLKVGYGEIQGVYENIMYSPTEVTNFKKAA